MNKGMTTETVVKLIVFAAGLIVLLTTLVPGIWDLLFSTADVGECSLEFILNNLGNTDALSGCEMNNVVVTPNMIYEYSSSSRKEYYDQLNKGSLARTADVFNPSSEGAEEMWALNKIIGNELTGCVDKTLGGKFLEREGIGAAFSTDVVCVICSRIVITDAALDIFRGTRNFDQGRGIDSYFSIWSEEVIDNKKKMTYANYANQATKLDPEEEVDRLHQAVADNYQIDINKPLAVVLVNIPLSGLVSEHPDKRWIDIYEYEDITTMTFPWSTLVTGDLKCETIIS